jgi:hypothetical protein
VCLKAPLYNAPIQTLLCLFFPVVDRCLFFQYAISNLVSDTPHTELNVYKEGKGINKTRIFHTNTTTNFMWENTLTPVGAVEDLKVSTVPRQTSILHILISIKG